MRPGARDALRKAAAHPLVRVVAVALLQHLATRLAEPGPRPARPDRACGGSAPPPRKAVESGQ
ncbi:hypothetical protein [Streptomyces sp. NBC_01306]|uniref:hypothetical protein n=1 Tax=Streptomyces sp. NBC_01306 TaxID=2903819 RepID=UPI00225B2FD5|nr:hypothetical protein [Streptomyces sp. NBC_01306]MCX4729120.1 hypothetical protein [Streptomyces sp. NBC_01306]